MFHSPTVKNSVMGFSEVEKCLFPSRIEALALTVIRNGLVSGSSCARQIVMLAQILSDCSVRIGTVKKRNLGTS